MSRLGYTKAGMHELMIRIFLGKQLGVGGGEGGAAGAFFASNTHFDIFQLQPWRSCQAGRGPPGLPAVVAVVAAVAVAAAAARTPAQEWSNCFRRTWW